jgi:hypothetical protein
MKKILAQMGTFGATVFLVAIAQVMANEPKGEGPPDYSGITGMYYTLIGLVLAYGVYDTFLKKN